MPPAGSRAGPSVWPGRLPTSQSWQALPHWVRQPASGRQPPSPSQAGVPASVRGRHWQPDSEHRVQVPSPRLLTWSASASNANLNLTAESRPEIRARAIKLQAGPGSQPDPPGPGPAATASLVGRRPGMKARVLDSVPRPVQEATDGGEVMRLPVLAYTLSILGDESRCRLDLPQGAAFEWL